MLHWHIVFKGEKSDTIIEGEEDVLERYDTAIMTQKVDGRPVLGMWIVAPGTENEDVLRAWGRCPYRIFTRYQTRQAQLKEMGPG